MTYRHRGRSLSHFLFSSPLFLPLFALSSSHSPPLSLTVLCYFLQLSFGMFFIYVSPLSLSCSSLCSFLSLLFICSWSPLPVCCNSGPRDAWQWEASRPLCPSVQPTAWSLGAQEEHCCSDRSDLHRGPSVRPPLFLVWNEEHLIHFEFTVLGHHLNVKRC